MKDDYHPYELDKPTGHLFCKYCGNNYLMHEHKEGCEYFEMVKKAPLQSRPQDN